MVAESRATGVDKLIEDWAGYLSAHDTEQFLTLFSDDVVYEDVTFGIVNHGKKELRDFIAGFFPAFPDISFELKSHFAAGTWAGMEWVMAGTHKGDLPGMPASGKRCSVRGATILELEAGKIKRNSDYWDLATMMKQLGFMPKG
jgi:steroid delta-isomerase-like uncharacterized protein